MLGFFTLIAFLLALSARGWFWLFFLIMLGAWGNKLEKEKKKKVVATPPIVASTTSNKDGAVKQTGDARKQTEQLGNSNDWVIELTQVCSHYSASGYYVAELIPEQKLRNALKAYPLPGGGRVIALIDTTLFGAADDGMLIGENGLSWHNLGTESKVSSMRWDEFAKANVFRDGSKILIGRGDGIFDTTGTSLDKDKILELLRGLQVLYSEYQETRKVLTAPPANEKPVATDVNTATYDTLLSLPGIGAAEAKMILDKRSTGEFFQSLDELTELLNLKPHKVEQLKNLIVFSKPVSPSPANKPSPQDNSPKHPYVATSPQPAPSQPASRGRVID